MTRDALVVGISGTLFGLIVGWILGSQMAAPPAAAPSAVTASSQQADPPPPPPLDAERAAELEKQARAQPANAGVRVELANVYYDARRFDLAIPWYEAALAIEPKNVNASTDLAICYYYTNDVDRALAQIDRSLAVDPRHVKSLFNQGVMRFGKEDRQGAAESWEKVVSIAPDSDEARMARQGLDGLRSGHTTGRGSGGRP
jgi:cytochrome c-type biogenesis protein CcmH/NrfG